MAKRLGFVSGGALFSVFSVVNGCRRKYNHRDTEDAEKKF